MKPRFIISLLAGLFLGLFNTSTRSYAEGPAQELICVAPDKRSFEYTKSKKPFVPWGFNYDHDEKGRLIEDYWNDEWKKVEEDFAEMKQLGANVVRIHLQFGKFMDSADKANEKSLKKLSELIKLAEKLDLYLDLTGLACYHRRDVPAWYDDLDEKGRWSAQAIFWEAIAKIGSESATIFCYDLMNEPVVPGGKRNARDWLGPPFAGKHFVQMISLDQADRPRHEIAKQWIAKLVAAIRKIDKQHMVTVGLVDWSIGRYGLSSGFIPKEVVGELDFVSVHLYPESKKLDEAIKTLEGFAVGKPVLIEETFILKCSSAEWTEFFDRSKKHACGWIGFYWGATREELKSSHEIGDTLMHEWLKVFQASTRPKSIEKSVR